MGVTGSERCELFQKDLATAKSRAPRLFMQPGLKGCLRKLILLQFFTAEYGQGYSLVPRTPRLTHMILITVSASKLFMLE